MDKDLSESLTQLQAELAAWKKPFGPQTPEEIDIFIEEAVRVEREVHEYRYKALYFRFTKVRAALLIKAKAAELWKKLSKVLYANLKERVEVSRRWEEQAAKDHTRAVLWKKLAKSYRERHRWNSDVIERLQKEVELGDKSRSLWKKFAKRSWQGWGYASKLHKAKHEEFVRAAKHIDQLKSECNVWLEKIADLNRRLGNLAASHDFPRAVDVAKIYELEQKLQKLQPTLKAFDELKETLRRYEGCPAEDYPNAWWRARAIIREVKSDQGSMDSAGS